jgi:hypothetical protein
MPVILLGKLRWGLSQFQVGLRVCITHLNRKTMGWHMPVIPARAELEVLNRRIMYKVPCAKTKILSPK